MIAIDGWLITTIVTFALFILGILLFIGVIALWNILFDRIIDLLGLKKEFIQYMWDKRRKLNAKPKMQ